MTEIDVGDECTNCNHLGVDDNDRHHHVEDCGFSDENVDDDEDDVDVFDDHHVVAVGCPTQILIMW